MKNRKLSWGLLLLVIGGICIFMKQDIRFWGLMLALRPSTKKFIAHYCKNEPNCLSELRTSGDGCSREAIGQSDSLFVGSDPKKLSYCLQRRFATHHCNGESKCLAVVDGLYDKCFRIVFDDPSNLRSPASSDQFASCLHTKSYLVE